ncbi:hypothetical protein ABZS63_07365, partial [Streptomyces sp. NPDC005568]
LDSLKRRLSTLRLGDPLDKNTDIGAINSAEQRSLDHLTSEQREDGGWPVRWRQWAPGTALECRPMVTIEALRTLRAYGRPLS